MKKNIGKTDKIIRMALAAIIAILYFTGVIPGAAGIILLAFAVVFVLTGTINLCPLYIPLRLNTNRKSENK